MENIKNKGELPENKIGLTEVNYASIDFEIVCHSLRWNNIQGDAGELYQIWKETGRELGGLGRFHADRL